MNRKMLEQLAKAIPAKACVDQKHLGMKKLYYFFNVYHPAIEPLYKRYRHSIGAIDNAPLSDAQRTEFELSLLNGGALRELQKYCAIEDDGNEKETL